MTSEIAVSQLAYYTASKHAIAGLTKAAALERRFGTPEEVARTMLFIVCDARYASGDAFPVDGGILAGIMMGE